MLATSVRTHSASLFAGMGLTAEGFLCRPDIHHHNIKRCCCCCGVNVRVRGYGRNDVSECPHKDSCKNRHVCVYTNINDHPWLHPSIPGNKFGCFSMSQKPMTPAANSSHWYTKTHSRVIQTKLNEGQTYSQNVELRKHTQVSAVNDYALVCLDKFVAAKVINETYSYKGENKHELQIRSSH